MAGRSQTKLQDIVNESKRLNPDRALPAIEVVDSSNDESVTALVRKTYVLVTTVGPYCMYGEGVFRACAENGTHYVDCTGEFPWVSRMISRYEAKAKASGAIMLPQNGVESAPSDLSTWALAKHLREKLGAKTRQVTIVFHELKSSPSGGTLATALALFDYFTIAEVRDAGKPYALSPVPRSQSAYARPPESLWNKLVGARSLAPFGTVTTSIAAITDGSQVERTWGLLRSTPARRSEDYGPNFTWAQYMRVPGFLQGLAIHVGLGLGLLVLAFLPPVRGLLRRFVYQPGQGDDRDVANRDSLEYRGIAEPDDGGKSQSRAQCSIVWKGPTYLCKFSLSLSRLCHPSPCFLSLTPHSDRCPHHRSCSHHSRG